MNEEKNKFILSKYSIEDLEQFRDENGFIDLSKIELELSQESREKRGTEERVKNWVDFNGTKALIRGEAEIISKNYSIYAELIVEEIAKQLNIPTAHYDLVKIEKENGEIVDGVLSESIIDFETEDLVTLHDLIGNEPEEDLYGEEEIEYMFTTRYKFTEQKLKERFEKSGFDEETTDKLINDYKKRLVFTMAIADADKHTENMAFILNKKNGALRLAPNYDSELSLFLERDLDTLRSLISGRIDIEEELDSSDTKIGTYVSKEDGGHGVMWKDTLEELCEDDEIYDYFCEIIDTIDIDSAIKCVEERIKAPLPKIVKLITQKTFKIRKRTMKDVMELDDLELEEDYDENDLAFDDDLILEEDEFGAAFDDEFEKEDDFRISGNTSALLEFLINGGLKKGIGIGEFLSTGQNIEEGMNDRETINETEEYIQLED